MVADIRTGIRVRGKREVYTNVARRELQGLRACGTSIYITYPSCPLRSLYGHHHFLWGISAWCLHISPTSFKFFLLLFSLSLYFLFLRSRRRSLPCLFTQWTRWTVRGTRGTSLMTGLEWSIRCIYPSFVFIVFDAARECPTPTSNMYQAISPLSLRSYPMPCWPNWSSVSWRSVHSLCLNAILRPHSLF